jgi:site-specific DNA-methyltransferase (adenine-specific)
MTKGSKTSPFGTTNRISHDSSTYYNARLNSELPAGSSDELQPDHSFPIDLEDHIVLGTAEDMSLIPDRSVHLMVTSPPYNVTKEYDADLSPGMESHSKKFLRPCLVDGGRAASMWRI